MSFGSWLKNEMRIRGINQPELAQLTGIEKSGISRIVNDKRKPEIANLQRIARGLNIPDERVFEAAGYLRPTTDTDQESEEMLALFSRLSPDQRHEVMRYARYVFEHK